MAESGENMMQNLFQEKIADCIRDGDQNTAFRLIKNEREKSIFGVSFGALNELKARVLMCRNAADKGKCTLLALVYNHRLNSFSVMCP